MLVIRPSHQTYAASKSSSTALLTFLIQIFGKGVKAPLSKQ